MKKLCLLAALIMCLTPTLVRAHDHDADDYKDRDHDRDRWHHDHDDVTAAEMTGIGIGGAALIGVAGYLILRKRNLSA